MHRRGWFTPCALTLLVLTAGCGNMANNAGSAGFSYKAIGNGSKNGGNGLSPLPVTMNVIQIDPSTKTVLLAVRDAKTSRNLGRAPAQAANFTGSVGTGQSVTIPVGWTLHVSGPGRGRLLGDGVISVLRYPFTNSPSKGIGVNPQNKSGRTAITNTPQADTWGLRGANVATVIGGPVAARDTTFKATIPGQYAIVWATEGGPPRVLSRITVSNTIAKPFVAPNPGIVKHTP